MGTATPASPTEPGLTFATRNGWAAITRGEGCLRRFHVGFPTEHAAREYARTTA